MKNDRYKQADLETLSAYLDQQLTEVEEQALHNRLSQDKALQARLDGLRQTRYVLRQTPKVKRPRSFALSPEMVKQQSFAFRMMNISRMVSAAASILLIMAIGGQYLVRGGGFAASQANENAVSVADEAAEAGLAEEPMAMEAPAEEMQMDDAVEEEAAAEEPAAAAEMAPAATPTPAGTSEPGGGGGEPPGVDGGLATDEGTGEIMGIGGGPTLTPDARSLPSEKTPGEAADQFVSPEESASPSSADEMDGQGQFMGEPPRPETDRALSPLRIVQAVLLLLALAAGFFAVYFRKQVR
jgi:hypothetical protein